MYRKKVLDIVLGGIADFVDGSDNPPDGNVPNEDHRWLHQWNSIADVRSFFRHVKEQKKAKVNVEMEIDWGIVDCTVLDKDPLNVLCILTNAFFSVDINRLESKISTALNKIIEETSISCPYVDHDLSHPGLYDIKWAWLLFCSQTVGHGGEVLQQGYELYPIFMAKELLEKQENGLAVIAEKILYFVFAAMFVSCMFIFFNVGQANFTLLKTNEKAVVIDCGTKRMGEKKGKIHKEMKDFRILGDIKPTVLISHMDNDHYCGLEEFFHKNERKEVVLEQNIPQELQDDGVLKISLMANFGIEMSNKEAESKMGDNCLEIFWVKTEAMGV
jgi:hypothetical protein